MQDNILSFIGLARKAGSLELGAEKVYEMSNIGKCKLVVLSSDVSANTEKSVRNTCSRKNTPVIKTDYTKEEIGPAVGYSQCVVLTVTDTGFAQALAQKMGETEASDMLDSKKAREKRRLEKKHSGKRQ